MTREPETLISSAAHRVLCFLNRSSVEVENAAVPEQLLLRGVSGTISIRYHSLEPLIAAGYAVLDGARLSATESGRALFRLKTPKTINPDMGADVGTPHAANDGSSFFKRSSTAESPLAFLYSHRDISGERFLTGGEFDAGERLRADFTRGCMMPSVTTRWNAGLGRGKLAGAGGHTDLSDAAMSARLRVDKALKAVGPELNGVLIDICCFLKGLQTVERERRWPARSAKILLKTALGILCRHYTPPVEKSDRPFHWGSDDYRPKLQREKL